MRASRIVSGGGSRLHAVRRFLFWPAPGAVVRQGCRGGASGRGPVRAWGDSLTGGHLMYGAGRAGWFTLGIAHWMAYSVGWRARAAGFALSFSFRRADRRDLLFAGGLPRERSAGWRPRVFG